MEKKISNSKKCTDCKQKLPAEAFPAQSKKCSTCRYTARRKAASATAQNFLTRSFGQLKDARMKKEKSKKGWEITLEDVLELWELQKGRCALTGLFMTFHKDGSGRRDLNVSIDRIDPDVEYLVTNIQLVCLRVNTMKHTMKEDELYWWAKNIVECKENE